MNNLFVHIGMGTIIQRSRVLFITAPGSTTANRYIEEAKKAKPARYHNATKGHKYRSLIVMDEGSVIMSTITPMTLMKRMNSIEMVADEPEDLEECDREEEDDEGEEDE